MLNKKRKTEEHNFRKILRKKPPFRSILPEDMQSADVHNLWQEEKSSPLAINYKNDKKEGILEIFFNYSVINLISFTYFRALL
jgi:hypothetical protein